MALKKFELTAITCGIFLYFIKSRIQELIKLIGIINSIIHKYLNYHVQTSGPSSQSNVFDFKFNPGIVVQQSSNYSSILNYSFYNDIDKSIEEIIKITRYHNDLIYFLHCIKCRYDDQINYPTIGQHFFNNPTRLTFEKWSKIPTIPEIRSDKIKFNNHLLKELFKTF